MRKSRDLVSSGHSESLLHQPQNRRFPNASILPPIKNATTVPGTKYRSVFASNIDNNNYHYDDNNNDNHTNNNNTIDNTYNKNNSISLRFWLSLILLLFVECKIIVCNSTIFSQIATRYSAVRICYDQMSSIDSNNNNKIYSHASHIDGQKALAQQRRRSLNKDAVVDEDFSMLLSLQNGTAAATSRNNQSMMTAASNRSKRPLIEHEFNDEDDDESDEYANDDKQGNFCCYKKLSNDDKMIICGSEMMEVVEVMRVKKNYENLIGADADDRRQREQLQWWCQRRESSELPSKIPMAAATAAADVVDDVDGVMRLVFDSDFDCYFDPSTGQYYRVLPKNKQ